MNQELYLIRGEYVTLQTEAKQLETQIASLAQTIDTKNYPFTAKSARSTFMTNGLVEIINAAQAMQPLVERHIIVSERLKDLKPLAAL